MQQMHWREVGDGREGLLRIAVLGDDPEVHPIADCLRFALRELRQEAEVCLVESAPEEFRDCISHLHSKGFAAASIGNPLKVEAAKAATQFFLVKQAMGVANALKLGSSIYAQNTEVQAFASAIADIKPGTALVMGSGRAARTAVISLFEKGWRVKVWNRNVLRSKPFVVAFETYGKVELLSSPDPAGCSLIVNATSLGRKAGEQPPVKWEAASPRTTAIDFVHRQVATEFLRSASSRGFRTIDGRSLLVEQAALALEWWIAGPVPRQAMFEAIGFKPGS